MAGQLATSGSRINEPALPGQAAVIGYECQASVVVCDVKENLHLGGARLEIVGGIQRITIAGGLVPVVMLVVRVTAEGKQRYYSAWIDELEENVIESLGTQSMFPIILASHLGERVGRGSIPNGQRELAQSGRVTQRSVFSLAACRAAASSSS